MGQRRLSVTGYVLAGGASSRMGKPKIDLVLGHETMLARQIRLLRVVTRSVAVIGPATVGPNRNVPVLVDEIPGRGPLGGIYTGLLRSRTEFNLFLGCDLPFMESRFLDYLCRRALEVRAAVTVPESRQHGLEPLCAVYRRRIVKTIRAALESGENKIDRFFPRVRCFVIPWREIARAGFPPRIFVNMNTPEDYELAKKRF